MTGEAIKPKKALLSLTKKDELAAEFAKTLDACGIEIFSTKGTSSFLISLGIKPYSIEDYTGFPEILDGRVKTLHPKIFGGILAKREKSHHHTQAEEHGIKMFDIVCVDLYPARDVIAQKCTIDELIDNIDIGGISLIRAGAKAFKYLAVVSNRNDYEKIAYELNSKGSISYETRLQLAVEAFKTSSAYDDAIMNYLNKDNDSNEKEEINLSKIQVLRYGENPHQKAAYFKQSGTKGTFISEVIKGELSYNNILDLDPSVELSLGLKTLGYKHVAVIVKHGSPSGVGVSNESVDDAFNKAWECDTVANYGGILAISEELNESFLSLLKGKFVELIAAPSFTKSFVDAVASRQKLKVIKIDPQIVLHENRSVLRNACMGLLSQERDNWWTLQDNLWESMSERRPTEEELAAMKLGCCVSAVVKSNAVVLCTADAVLGIGGGCVSRVDAVKMAIDKAAMQKEKARGPIAMVSDGFFPFADSIDIANDFGVSAVMEPGGSIRDKDVIESCKKLDMALMFTGQRHFRH